MLRWLFLVLALLFAPLAMAADVNINTASSAELDTLPGIGPAKAQAIIDFREGNGPFGKIDEIINVPGIGPATWANIQSLITIGDGTEHAAKAGDEASGDETAAAVPTADPGGPPTNGVNVNTAGQTELETMPGIGPTKAAAIVADRDANGPFGSCQELSRVTGIGPATVANIATVCTAQ